ncbi:transposase [Desulfoscipio geothermicus]|uniref:transposase n=1 Tax=Desulfoscipio geothermicus TaxID=39060 RepID=UPI0013F4CBF2|nr:transposase [Desulfoscipio geothermicus]
MPEEEVIRIYGLRWDIEVYFKVCKSFLRLAKEFQSRSYDAMFAHITIVTIRYIMLAVENREQVDNRAYGGIFYQF